MLNVRNSSVAQEKLTKRINWVRPHRQHCKIRR